MKIKIAFSPCPNDTFIFHHLVHKGTANLEFEPVFLDIEQLNHEAFQNTYPLTKLSFAAMAHLQDSYQLLDCGGALGRACGPLLIHKQQGSVALDQAQIILIPGVHTTANLLLHLYLHQNHIQKSQIQFKSMRYDKIIPAIQNDMADFGLLIHEERFSFQDQNLAALVDLGEWWEQTTGLPIPLGCIAAKKSLGLKMIREIEDGIRRSIQNAYDHPEQSLDFIKQHSQSLNDEVLDAHIKLYVNDYSFSFGDEGQQAIAELFKRARELSDPGHNQDKGRA